MNTHINIRRKGLSVLLALMIGTTALSFSACDKESADKSTSQDISSDESLPNTAASSADPEDTSSLQDNDKTDSDSIKVAVAWSNVPDSYSYTSTLKTVEETAKSADVELVVLDMVRPDYLEYDNDELKKEYKDEHGILSSQAAKLVKTNGWAGSDADKVMEDVDCIIFPGGWDISPTLYYNEQPWHGIEEDGDFSAERDVSDYILLKYCIDNNIPTLCICRGMQMLSVVSGADMIQDIGTWFKEKGIDYDNEHRDPEKKDLVPHPADIIRDSQLYEILGTESIDGVPSWHHQLVGSIDDTALTVNAVTTTQGEQIIEGVERADRSFCIGVQFHPEVAVCKNADKEDNAADFMDYDKAMSLFYALEEAASEDDSEAIQKAA